ncbi:uncharacterized protein LOC127712782 [Mytilus californianus]|uniref:uncharacterized protein LOC127712782 n=1 Tax=Mytilus californianus TaxID=6549 RepID=UPI002246B245|nr:uncharacterized protein LOC127712782 [Mytilus californianus]
MEDMPREMTAEEICYLRIVHLLLQIAKPVVRDKFNTEFHPTKLKAELNRNYKVLDDLRKKRVIYRHQWERMFPNSEPVSSEKFDITLMICLLRHLAKINIQDGFPSSGDKSEATDLSRIKRYRNKVLHCDEGTLTNQEFNQYWDDISQAIVRLGGSKYQEQCDDLKRKEFDAKDKDLLNELKFSSRSTIPKGVAVINEKLLDEWSTKEKSVVRTRAIQTLMTYVDKNAVVTIIGPPGCGKSTSAHYVAFYLHQSKKYEVISTQNAKDIVQYYNPDNNQVFVFDDICGKYTSNNQKIMEWRDLTTDVNLLLENKRIKIIGTCRIYILKERALSKTCILSNTFVDFTSEYCALSDEEKINIARVFLEKDDILKLQKSKQYTKYEFFPLLCDFYSRHRKRNIKDFFTSPIEAISTELSYLDNAIDLTSIATLFLFVVYNNCIHSNILNSKLEMRQVLDNIAPYFQTAYPLNPVLVKQVLQNQISSFTKTSNDIFTIIHDKIFDILVLYFGKHYLKLCLEMSHSEVIRDRFKFESNEDDSATEQTSCMIIVPYFLEESYFDRLCQDIANGFVDDVFNNINLINVNFQTRLVRYLENRKEVTEELLFLSDQASSPLLSVARHGFFPIVEMLIKMGLNVNICDEKDRTPLFLASDGGHKDITTLLLKYNADTKICDTKERSPLHIASARGFTEIVALFLKNGIMSISTSNMISPLYIATIFGNIDIVQLFLENGFDPNVQTTFKQTPIYAACYFNYLNIVKLLLHFNCNTNICTQSLKSPLFCACLYGYTSVVKLLLDNGSDPNLCHIGGDRVSEYVPYLNEPFETILFYYHTTQKPLPAFVKILQK